jgi:hypothetical protein
LSAERLPLIPQFGQVSGVPWSVANAQVAAEPDA